MSFVPTPEQRAIIDHPLEPLRVSAGAGTGKTSTIVARAVRMIDEGLQPEQVLGVTFTNKAAEELADRLRAELPELARNGREIHVTTYHGFAWSLLQEFGALVGIERDATVIGPGYVRQLIGEQLGQMTFEAIDITSPPHRINDAATLGRQLAENLRQPADLMSGETGHDDAVWAMRRELAEVLDHYEKAKRRLGVVDYGDLVGWAYRLAAANPEISARVRGRYRLVLLDEYQDTDPSQRELLRSLFGQGFPVTAVGDADQTIYEWRGASLENFREFPRHFPRSDGSPATSLPLTLNRRSGRAILDLANRVRAMAQPEAAFAPLQPAPTAGDGTLHVAYHRTAAQEAASVATEVRRLHDEEGVPWSAIAVLFRKNRQIGLVREALADEGVPHEVASLGGLLDVPEVADLHAWLRVLGDPDDSAALVRLLLGGRFRLGLGDLVPPARWIRSRRGGDEDEEGPGWPHVEAIDRLEEVEGLTDAARSRLERFRAIYRRLLAAAQSSSLAELCRRILDATDAWVEVDAADPPAALSARLNLYRFLDLAEEWSPLEGRPSLDAFLGYLELLQDAATSDELDTARLGGHDAVALLTVHRAKGLEWDTVFVPGATTGTFPAFSRGFDNPRDKPQFLPFEMRLDAASLPSLEGEKSEVNAALRSRHDAQEWRTAYVATTRARSRLYVSGAWWYTEARPGKPSELFNLAAAVPGASVGPVTDAPGDPPTPLDRSTGGAAPDPIFPAGWQEALRRLALGPAGNGGEPRPDAAGPTPESLGASERSAYDAAVDQIKLVLEGLPASVAPEPAPRDPAVSVTGLVTLATCPQRYAWAEIARLPRRPDPWLRHGVEVHRIIENHNRGQMALEELDSSVYDMEPVVDPPVRASGPVDAFKESRFATVKPRFVETPIEIALDAGRVRGRIDAVYEPEPGHWEIVDFKSGRPREDPAKAVQLEAYAVAAAEGAVAGDVPERISVTFAYLGGGSVVEETTPVDDGWLAGARAHLDELLTRATADVFARTPGPACDRCDFLHLCDDGRAWVESTTRAR